MMRKLSQTQEGRDSIAVRLCLLIAADVRPNRIADCRVLCVRAQSAFGMCPGFKLDSEDEAKEALWWSAWAFSFITEFNYPFPGLYAPEHTPPLPVRLSSAHTLDQSRKHTHARTLTHDATR
jgi:hypothetical protein